MMHIELTKHVIDQIEKRAKIKRKQAKYFAYEVFTNMMNNKEYKWWKIVHKTSKNWWLIVTNWNHKFIYKKELGWYVLITYAKVWEYSNRIEWMFRKIFKQVT